MTPEPRSSVRWQRRCSRLQVGAGDLGGVALGSSRRIGCLSSLAASLRSAAALALPAPPFNPPPLLSLDPRPPSRPLAPPASRVRFPAATCLGASLRSDCPLPGGLPSLICRPSPPFLLRRPAGRDPLIDVALALEAAARSDEYFVKRKLYPNVDFFSGEAAPAHLRCGADPNPPNLLRGGSPSCAPACLWLPACR